MESVLTRTDRYNPIIDLLFFIFLLLFNFFLDQYISKLLDFIFITQNNIISTLLFSIFIILFYKVSIFSANKIKIPNYPIYILVSFVVFLGIIKFFIQSSIISTILEVLLVDIGAIYIIFQIIKRYDVNVKNWLGLNLISIKKIRYFGIYFLAWPILILWGLIIEYFDLEVFKSTNYTKEIFNSLNNNYLFIFFIACIIAPFCEEVIFRGYLYKVIRDKSNIIFAVIINSLIFGVIHLQPSAIVPATILGVALSIIRIKTKSLLPSITIHTLHNLLALIITSQTL
jgi:membrane protease YdiL (CAAX protease family)